MEDNNRHDADSKAKVQNFIQRSVSLSGRWILTVILVLQYKRQGPSEESGPCQTQTTMFSQQDEYNLDNKVLYN